jgi:hypothetical protein
MIRVGSNNKDTPFSNVTTSVVALMAVAIEYVYAISVEASIIDWP